MAIQGTALWHAHIGEGGGFIRYQAGSSLSQRSQPSSHVRTWSFGGQTQEAKASTSARDASVPSPSVQTLRSSHVHLISVLRDLCWGAVRVEWIEGQVGLVRGHLGRMILGSGWMCFVEGNTLCATCYLIKSLAVLGHHVVSHQACADEQHHCGYPKQCPQPCLWQPTGPLHAEGH